MMTNKDKKLNYELPKFRKGQVVSMGTITAITYSGGSNWYEINGKYYAEREISKV